MNKPLPFTTKVMAVAFFACTALMASNVNAQHAPTTEKAVSMPSPPATAAGVAANGAKITINYSQPAVKGRNVWDTNGSLAPYGKVWRTGANKATTFETDKDIMVEGKSLKAGKYALFTIPGEKEWVIIFNSNSNQWGAYGYKEAEDVLRVTVPAQATDFTERVTIAVAADNVSLAWEKVKVAFSIK
jgi:Protein of unknown function (DUF2911)